MKSITTLSSIVLLAASLGFANSAMAAGDRVAPTRDGRDAINSPSTGGHAPGGATTLGPAATATAKTNAPASATASTAGAATISFTPTVPTGATGVTVEGDHTPVGTLTCTGSAPASCAYQVTNGDHLPTDTVGITLRYTFAGVVYTVRSLVNINIAPYTQS